MSIFAKLSRKQALVELYIIRCLTGTFEFYVRVMAENIEYGVIGEGFQISANQEPENSAFSLLIG